MKNIPFTQFHLPNGRQTKTAIPVDDETFDQFERVAASGFRMTVEILSNDKISMCIEDRELGDFDCVVCENGPLVPVKLKQMLMSFDPQKAVARRAEMNN